MRSLIILCFGFLLVTGLSCKKDLESSNVIVELDACASTSINGKSIEVCYLQLLEDSRCPANANCIWQGAAKARFSIRVGSEKREFDLSTIDLDPHYKNTTTQLGYHIRVVNLLPYPGLGGNIFKAELEITN